MGRVWGFLACTYTFSFTQFLYTIEEFRVYSSLQILFWTFTQVDRFSRNEAVFSWCRISTQKSLPLSGRDFEYRNPETKENTVKWRWESIVTWVNVQNLLRKLRVRPRARAHMSRARFACTKIWPRAQVLGRGALCKAKLIGAKRNRAKISPIIRPKGLLLIFSLATSSLRNLSCDSIFFT